MYLFRFTIYFEKNNSHMLNFEDNIVKLNVFINYEHETDIEFFKSKGIDTSGVEISSDKKTFH